MKTTTAADISPTLIYPPHEVRDEDKYEALVAGMAKGGWSGRPVLAWRATEDDCVRAITGSHRIAAARAAGLETIPVLVIECDDDADAVDALDAIRDQDEATDVLAEIDAATDARDLMAAEVD